MISSYRERNSALWKMRSAWELIPEGVNISRFIPGKNGEETTDCFVTFSFLDDKKNKILPLCYASCDIEREKVLFSGECEEQILSSGIMDSDPAACLKYDDLYETVRRVAFHAGLSEEDRTAVREYLSVWQSLYSPEFRLFIEKLFPDFFVWAENM